MGDYIPPTDKPYARFDAFSASYVALIMYVILVAVCMKKDLSMFIKMGSLGAICVTIIIVFVFSYWIYSMTNTDYKVFTTPDSADPMKPVKDLHYLFLINPSGFSNLAAVLCTGYYIHQFSIPIISNAEEP